LSFAPQLFEEKYQFFTTRKTNFSLKVRHNDISTRNNAKNVFLSNVSSNILYIDAISVVQKLQPETMQKPATTLVWALNSSKWSN